MPSEVRSNSGGHGEDDQSKGADPEAERSSEGAEKSDPDAPGSGIAEGETPAEPNEPG